MNSIEGIDEYAAASGEPALRGEDLELLERYASLQDGRYCRHGSTSARAPAPRESRSRKC